MGSVQAGRRLEVVILGRPKAIDVKKRDHLVKVRLNNKEYDMLKELLWIKPEYKTFSGVIRMAIRHDFVWFTRDREDTYYEK